MIQYLNEYTSEHFDTGSLNGLQTGIQVVLESLPELWKDQIEPIFVKAYGNEDEEGIRLEIFLEGRLNYRSIGLDYHQADSVLFSRAKFLDELIENNTPSLAGRYACDCEEYCDNDHGEGPLEFEVGPPSGHDMAEALIKWEKLNASDSNSKVHTSRTKLASVKPTRF